MKKGVILPIVIISLLFLALVVPLMVKLSMEDTKASVSDQKKSIAFNLAEAAVDRGYWKVKSSTATCAAALDGVILSGYNFDSTYTDIQGGTYRIKISSATDRCIVILGEGRDNAAKEVRAITAIFKNQSINSPLIATGSTTMSKVLGCFWGPIMSHGSLSMTDAVMAKRYFPRKFSKGVVTGHGSFVRDINGLDPPNTDGIEWWSDYQYIQELPIPNFTALRASATATGTLNRYDSGTIKKFPNQPADDSGPDLVWYWDGNVTFKGHEAGSNYGFKGTVIVRGNLNIESYGKYKFTSSVPVEAWRDHQKLLQTTFDTASTMEYPADIGYQANKTSFNFGTESFRPYPGLSAGWRHTVGVRGFTYVGGNLHIKGPWGFMDFIGAVWVVGNITTHGGSANAFCGVFFNDQLEIPTLNVILIRQSWQEVSPSPQAW